MVVAYFVVTSSGFIKRVILPRVSAAIHADVTVTDISVHPFSKITVRGLKVQAKGQEPVITAPEVRASYSLWSILRGKPPHVRNRARVADGRAGRKPGRQQQPGCAEGIKQKAV